MEPKRAEKSWLDKQNIHGTFAYEETDAGSVKKNKVPVKVYKNNDKLEKWSRGDNTIRNIEYIRNQTINLPIDLPINTHNNRNPIYRLHNFSLIKVTKKLERNTPLGIFLSVITVGLAPLFLHQVRDLFFSEKTTYIAVPLDVITHTRFSTNVSWGIDLNTAITEKDDLYSKNAEIFMREYIATHTAGKPKQDKIAFIKEYLQKYSIPTEEKKKEKAFLAYFLYSNLSELGLSDLDKDEKIDLYQAISQNFNSQIHTHLIRPEILEGELMGLFEKKWKKSEEAQYLEDQIAQVKQNLTKGSDCKDLLKELSFYMSANHSIFNSSFTTAAKQMIEELTDEVISKSQNPFATYKQIYEASKGCMIGREKRKNSGNKIEYFSEKLALCNQLLLESVQKERLEKFSNNLSSYSDIEQKYLLYKEEHGKNLSDEEIMIFGDKQKFQNALFESQKAMLLEYINDAVPGTRLDRYEEIKKELNIKFSGEKEIDFLMDKIETCEGPLAKITTYLSLSPRTPEYLILKLQEQTTRLLVKDLVLLRGTENYKSTLDAVRKQLPQEMLTRLYELLAHS